MTFPVFVDTKPGSKVQPGASCAPATGLLSAEELLDGTSALSRVVADGDGM